MYELLPLRNAPERAEIISYMLREIAKTPSLFSSSMCESDPVCLEETPIMEMCPACKERMATVTAALGKSDTVAWEVWEGPEIQGIIYFTNVTAEDALGHYVFFDRDLASKTGIIREALSIMLEKLPRLTIEIPASYVALAKHAHKKLKFGGPYEYRLRGGRSLRVEGVKKSAALRRGRREDVLVLGLVRS